MKGDLKENRVNNGLRCRESQRTPDSTLNVKIQINSITIYFWSVFAYLNIQRHLLISFAVLSLSSSYVQ